ncbi:MAG: RNA polymerase sigma factor [Gemmatimonadales bacterium]
MTPTDDSLVARLGAGEPVALAELIEKHGPPLMRFATHFLHSAADADEVLQDVFIRADRAIRKGTRPERLDAWLFRITVNRCRSKRRRWWPFVSGPAADRSIERAITAPTDDAFAWREEIEAALATLSPALREAFLLKHVQGLEYQEMTAITSASVPALKMRVARACEQLRARLKEVDK